MGPYDSTSVRKSADSMLAGRFPTHSNLLHGLNFTSTLSSRNVFPFNAAMAASDAVSSFRVTTAVTRVQTYTEQVHEHENTEIKVTQIIIHQLIYSCRDTTVTTLDVRHRSMSSPKVWLYVDFVRAGNQESSLGDRAFPVAAARAWKTLLVFLRTTSSFLTFHHELNTFLFNISFPDNQ